MATRGKVVAGARGNCVHVAGAANFLALAEQVGYEPVFLGPAVAVDRFVAAVAEHDPEIVGIGYRLTPEVLPGLLAELRAALAERDLLRGRRYVFGGTPPTAAAATAAGWFERAFTGFETTEEVIAFLRGEELADSDEHYGATQLERLRAKAPYPLLRHHFGLPTLEETLAGVRQIALSKLVDVISLAPDQNAQECFFRPEEMDPALDGAGGVPIRTADDLRRLYQASRCGNHPLLRIYSGTRDLVRWAELAHETIHNAWGAIPLCWYSELDGRSRRGVAEAIAENQAAMRWHAEHGVPVEVNESHHWSLREAHDAVAVAMAYLAAYNARQMGVRHYIAQYMFNTPAGTYATMDLAKMLAKAELIESLHNEQFTTFRQVRAGLLHFAPDLELAKGQLAASTMLALALKPHIIHVVGFTEGDHAARPAEVIESCKIVRGVLKNCLFGLPDMAADPRVQQRKEQLVADARRIIAGIGTLGDGRADPLADPETLSLAVRTGLVDAPQLRGNPAAAGLTCTRTIEGAVYAIDPETRQILPEAERIRRLLPAAAHAARDLPPEGTWP
ncbi:MAG: cobalamin B12-binding domain-containing protein [Armatimonadetes bacterium]|nr:cobalamin B12-binding domain-containing protein [Armatimonadota bacterium]